MYWPLKFEQICEYALLRQWNLIFYTITRPNYYALAKNLALSFCKNVFISTRFTTDRPFCNGKALRSVHGVRKDGLSSRTDLELSN